MDAPPGGRRPGEAAARTPLLVGEVFDTVLAADPAREALVTRSGRWSYAELDSLADSAAAVLAGLGVKAGDRVGAALPNEVDVVAAFHGAMRLGAVWVGVNRALAPPEKAYALSDSGTRLLLCDTDTRDQLARLGGELPDLGRVVVADGTEAGGEWREALAAAPEGVSHRRPLDPDAPAALAYTSGTTGHPKGAVHSQRNLLLPGAVLVATRRYTPSLRKGDCLPLTILNMLVLTTLLVAQAGGTTVVMDRIDAGGVADWIEEERVTTWNGPPALLYSMVHDDSIRPGALRSLDEVWVGGADCPETLREDFAAKFGLPVLGTYGLTEAPTVVAIDPRPDERGAGRAGEEGHRPGASGRPLPHLDLRIVGEDGEALPPGETGEICLGPVGAGRWAGAYHPPLGYWSRPEAGAELLRGGVVHTGDLGYLDGDGWLFVRDRRNQTINRGGANVYPAEVERVLGAAPGVAACAVFGVPDERLGQRVAAAVEPRPGAAPTPEELREHCAAQLARYKIPDRFVLVDSFPRNSMGKIDRRSLGALVGPEPLP